MAFFGRPTSFGSSSGFAIPTVTKTRISFWTFWRLFHPKSFGPIHGSLRRYGMPESTSSSVVFDSPPMTAVAPSFIVNSVVSRLTSMMGYCV